VVWADIAKYFFLLLSTHPICLLLHPIILAALELKIGAIGLDFYEETTVFAYIPVIIAFLIFDHLF